MTGMWVCTDPDAGCVWKSGACEIEYCAGNHLECCQHCDTPGPDHCGCCALFDPQLQEAS